MRVLVFYFLSTVSLCYAFQSSLLHPWVSSSARRRTLDSQVPAKDKSSSTCLFAFPPVAESIFGVASVVAIHEAGHFLAAKSQGVKIESFNIGYGPKLLAFNDSDNVEFALRAVPFGGYVSFPSNLNVSEEGVETIDEDPRLLENKPAASRLAVIAGGVLANLLLSVVLSANVALSSGISFPVFQDGLVITALSGSPSAVSPARLAGLAPQDVLLKVNGADIPGGPDAVSDFVAAIRRSENLPVQLQVLSRDQVREVTVTPRSDGGGGGRASIGVGVAPRIADVNLRKAQSPVEAVQLGVEQTGRLVSLTASSVFKGFRTGFAGMEVGGPLSVISQGASFIEGMSSPSSPAAASPLLAFAASLSVNLAVLNALPLPALDGGQFLLAFTELIARRKIPRKLKAGITAVSFLLLLGVAVWTSVGDLTKLAVLFR